MVKSSSKYYVILFSKIWTALIAVLLVPIYIKILGAESYGLVAFFATMSAALSILDLGLSTSISRQVAILMKQPNKEQENRDLIFSVEIVYWLIALGVGFLVVLMARNIAIFWINSKHLPIATIQTAVMLMGAVFAVQFPVSIYNGVLIGLDRQIANAVASLFFSTLKAVGVILVLKLASPTIENYFIWQVLISLISTYFFRFLVWNCFKGNITKPHFSFLQLKTITSFATGMTFISLITFFLAQIDKIVVSKYLSLDIVGYYNLAFLVASGITTLITPMQPILFPKFTALVAMNKKQELVKLFHQSARWIAIIVFPVGLIIIFFAEEILFLWTKDSTLTKCTAPIVKVVGAGTIFNCLMWVPYWYMLAKGITKFTIYQNLIAAIILVPFLPWATIEYGAIGASFVWLILNALYFLVSIPIFHKLYLKGELIYWYKNDILLPFICSILIVLSAKYFEVFYIDKLNISTFSLLISCCFLLYIILIPELRSTLLKYLNSIR